MRSLPAQIITGIKAQLILPDDKFAAFEQRLVGAAIGIGGDGLDQCPSAQHVNLQVSGRFSVRGIQNMGCQSAHWHSPE